MDSQKLAVKKTLDEWTHRERHGVNAQSGTLRAAVFGVNDGLVSNLSLVMGIAGAQSDSKLVLLAGVAGLLAGAFSMAAGEYVSMRAQREVFENQISVEQHELAVLPDEERDELQKIYEEKGLTPENAAQITDVVMSDSKLALETHVREELGLNPDELGSPWGAALSSFLAFVGGAVIPVIPYLLTNGQTAFMASIAASAAGLIAVGVILSFVTKKNWLLSGLRMLFIGGLAAAVTYFVGYLFSVSIGG
jgi:VIT1/CCC1 family predicted Fe2+/Mn2+ transporter